MLFIFVREHEHVQSSNCESVSMLACLQHNCGVPLDACVRVCVHACVCMCDAHRGVFFKDFFCFPALILLFHHHILLASHA